MQAKKIAKWLPKNGAFYSLIILCVVFGVMTPNFLTGSNFITVCRQASTVCIISLCSFLAILTHQTDLSVGATAGLTSVILVVAMDNWHLPAIVACLMALAVGAAIGALNGVLCGYTTIPPFIITLGTMYIGESVGIIITNGRTFSFQHPEFSWIGAGSIGVVPIPTIITLALVCLFGYIMKYRRYGTKLYAIGGNAEAALATGMNVRRLKLSVYVINGLLATVAGFILAARLSSANPSQGMGLEMDGICAAILGGTSLSGGVGVVWYAVLGAFTMSALSSGLSIVGVSSSVQMILVGTVIILILALDSIRELRTEKEVSRR